MYFFDALIKLSFFQNNDLNYSHLLLQFFHHLNLIHLYVQNNCNLDIAADKIIVPFDKNLWFLSMVAYISPFIGLFGTVWGVMDSFAAIGINQSVSIGVIAPGLAVALGTTALGLIAAVPAAIAHQYFAKKSDDLYDKLSQDVCELKCKK